MSRRIGVESGMARYVLGCVVAMVLASAVPARGQERTRRRRLDTDRLGGRSVVVAGGWDPNAKANRDAVSRQIQPPSLDAVSNEEARHIAFIDPTVAQFGKLVSAADGACEVVLLDTHRDFLTQIADKLSRESGVASIHVFTHGESGRILMDGSSALDAAALLERTEQLAEIRGALAENADILLYGCNIAAGEAGKRFVGLLSEATGADVAASSDLTGATRLGGDWDLEHSIGSIESGGIISREVRDFDATLVPTPFVVTTALDTGDDATYGIDYDADLYDGDGLSLREAVYWANNTPGHDTIQFGGAVVDDSAIVLMYDGALSTALHVKDDLTIDASGFTGLSLDADHGRRHFLVDSGYSLSLKGLTLERGSVVGDSYVGASRVGNDVKAGSILNFGSLSLTDCTIRQCYVLGGKGDIAPGIAKGGAIYNDYGSLALYSTVITACDALGGYGVAVGARAFGGGIFNEEGSISMDGSSITDCEAVAGFAGTNGTPAKGGGIYSYKGSLSMTGANYFEDCKAIGGSATAGYGGAAEGGAVYMYYGTISLGAYTGFKRCSAYGGDGVTTAGWSFGGALHCIDTPVTSSGDVYALGCKAVGGDGGVGVGGQARGGFAHVGGGSLALADSSIFNCAATSGDGDSSYGAFGGAISGSGSADITLDRCALANNTATGNGYDGSVAYGGAICSDGGALNVTNSTLYANKAYGGGDPSGSAGVGKCGAIYKRDGTLTIISSTIAGSVAGDIDGATSVAGIQAKGADSVTVDISNSIIADSVDGNDAAAPDLVITGTAITGGASNLIESYAGFPGAYVASTNDPQLGTLADNGGLTMTISPGPGSVAIDGGATALTVDQRGLTRPVGGADDIGAVESQAAADAFSVSEDATLTNNVMTNDVLAAATVTGNSDPSIGILTAPIAVGGGFTYDPNGAFEFLAVGENATDTFTYTISDGAVTEVAAVTITINGVNDAPTGMNDPGFNTHKATTVVFSSALLTDNDIDPDASDVLRVSGVVSSTSAEGASVTYNAGDDSITYDPSLSTALQNLDGALTLADTFVYNVTDDHGGFSTATVSLRVYSGPQEIYVTGLATAILDGDSTPDTADNTDFGAFTTGDPAAAHTFAITNTGQAPLDLTGTPRVSLVGAGFTLDMDAATAIAGGNATTFVISFSPSAAGTFNGTVSIANNDVDETPFNFNITAVVTTPPVVDDSGCTPGSGSPAWLAIFGFILAAWRALRRRVGGATL